MHAFRENPHLAAFAAPRHAITETSAGGREASEGPTLFHFFGQIRRQLVLDGQSGKREVTANSYRPRPAPRDACTGAGSCPPDVSLRAAA